MSAKNKEKIDIDYIALSDASKKSGYTPEYLNYLARKGKLKAKKIGRNWYTTFEWLDEFMGITSQTVSDLNMPMADSDIDKQQIIASKVQEHTGKAPEDKKTITELVIKSYKFTEEDQIKIRKEKSYERKKSAKMFGLALATVFSLFLFFQIGRFIDFGNIFLNQQNDDLFNVSDNVDWISESEGIVRGEETEIKDLGIQEGPTLMSENFQIKEIKFGGAIAVAKGLEDADFEIYDIRSEVLTTKGKEENKLVIRWKTSKLAKSTLEYSKMNGTSLKTIREENYNFDHSVTLSNLEPGVAYTFVIKSRDRWANEITSDRYSAYAGRKIVSIFDLIVNAVKEVFGWAMKEQT